MKDLKEISFLDPRDLDLAKVPNFAKLKIIKGADLGLKPNLSSMISWKHITTVLNNTRDKRKHNEKQADTYAIFFTT